MSYEKERKLEKQKKQTRGSDTTTDDLKRKNELVKEIREIKNLKIDLISD